METRRASLFYATLPLLTPSLGTVHPSNVTYFVQCAAMGPEKNHICTQNYFLCVSQIFICPEINCQHELSHETEICST